MDPIFVRLWILFQYFSGRIFSTFVDSILVLFGSHFSTFWMRIAISWDRNSGIADRILAPHFSCRVSIGDVQFCQVEMFEKFEN